MRKLFTLTVCLALTALSVMADTKETVTVNGSTINKQATQLTFSGDNVTLLFSDGTSQSSDMSNVLLSFSYSALFSNANSFDNLETIKTFGGKTVETDVTLSMRSGQWTPVCLPFDMTASEVAAIFGNGTKVAVMESTTATNINFVTTTDIKAGKPCIVNPGTDITNFHLASAAIGTMATGSTLSGEYFDMVGTINAVSPTADYYIMEGNRLKKLSSGSASPLGAYMTATGSDSDLQTFSIDGTPVLKPGDVDGDGRVTVTDVMVVVDYILGGHPTVFIYENANLDDKEDITVVDAMRIVDIILHE